MELIFGEIAFAGNFCCCGNLFLRFGQKFAKTAIINSRELFFLYMFKMYMMYKLCIYSCRDNVILFSNASLLIQCQCTTTSFDYEQSP